MRQGLNDPQNLLSPHRLWPLLWERASGPAMRRFVVFVLLMSNFHFLSSVCEQCSRQVEWVNYPLASVELEMFWKSIYHAPDSHSLTSYPSRCYSLQHNHVNNEEDCAVEAAAKKPITSRKVHQLNNSVSVCDSTEIEVLRLRKVSGLFMSLAAGN